MDYITAKEAAEKWGDIPAQSSASMRARTSGGGGSVRMGMGNS